MSKNKEGIGQGILHFISVSIVISIMQFFPEAIFWMSLIGFSVGYCAVIYSYKDNIKYIHIITLSILVIAIDIITYLYPDLLNLPETFSSTSEFYTTVILMSCGVYFIVSLLFHTTLKSHWINFVAATFIIMVYRLISQFEQFMSLNHTFIGFLSLVIGAAGSVGLFFFLGFILGNMIRKRISKY